MRRLLSSEDDDTNGDSKARKPHVGLQFRPHDKTSGKQSNHKTYKSAEEEAFYFIFNCFLWKPE
jgi:hypothetical protein